MFDVLLKRGLLVDGVSQPRHGDLAVDSGRIAAVGELAGATARTVIDAEGCVVSPGFIDVHTHGDLLAFGERDPGALELAAIRQGVTTQIVGNCGFSVFAYDTAPRAALQRHVASLLGTKSKVWGTLSEYATAASARGLIMNTASLVGHGSLRASLLDEVTAGADLEAALGRCVEAAVNDGAVGLSSGLVYAPGSSAETHELIAASRGLRGHGLPYVTHVRGETGSVMDSIAEAIEIAERAGVPLHVSHHKVAGPKNWGKSGQTLELLQAAAAGGHDVSVDLYPYTAASTSFHSLLPPWVHTDGFDAMLMLVERSDVRQRLRREIAGDGDRGWENLLGAAGWEGVRIARLPGMPQWEGKSLAFLAAQRGRHPLDAALEAQVLAGQAITVVLHVLSEDDVTQILASPLSMVGSDGIPLPGKPHPRWAGSFARVLGRYTRERAVLDLSTAVRKMSALPAQRFRLAGRGVLREAAVADLVVFDPSTIEDRATFDEPLEPPRGVRAVMVNGSIAVLDGEFTGRRAGDFLRADHGPPTKPL